jgi:hypothetical protein
MVSIKTNNGTSAKGVPLGTKKENQCVLWVTTPMIVTAKKIMTLMDIANIALVNTE